MSILLLQYKTLSIKISFAWFFAPPTLLLQPQFY